jgi:hypothetical protein
MTVADGALNWAVVGSGIAVGDGDGNAEGDGGPVGVWLDKAIVGEPPAVLRDGPLQPVVRATAEKSNAATRRIRQQERRSVAFVTLRR